MVALNATRQRNFLAFAFPLAIMMFGGPGPS